MTAVICRACGCGDDLGDGGYEVGFDWDRGLCAECADEMPEEDDDGDEPETVSPSWAAFLYEMRALTNLLFIEFREDDA